MEVMEYVYTYINSKGRTIDVFKVIGEDTYYHEDEKSGKIIKVTRSALWI